MLTLVDLKKIIYKIFQLNAVISANEITQNNDRTGQLKVHTCLLRGGGLECPKIEKNIQLFQKVFHCALEIKFHCHWKLKVCEI